MHLTTAVRLGCFLKLVFGVCFLSSVTEVSGSVSNGLFLLMGVFWVAGFFFVVWVKGYGLGYPNYE